MFGKLKSSLAERFPGFKPALDRVSRVRRRTIAAVVVLAHIAGALTSVRAVMDVRTAQGAIAWAVSLNTMPYIAVPAYWIFGRGKFQGYVVARRKELIETQPVAQNLVQELLGENFAPSETDASTATLRELARMPFTRRNHVDLLIDGEETFSSIFEALVAAEDYILVQFYIVRDDEIGRDLRDILVAKAEQGVAVYFLYDEIGSHSLPKTYFDDLWAAGATITAFNSTRGSANRFQLNFRNHRKIVVVDGVTAFVGGLNIGDEYLGRDPKLSPWRDTHVRTTGPVVQCVQVPFLEDWKWATDESLRHLNWHPAPSPEGDDMDALCIPSGPADQLETCTLFFLHVIDRAKERLWIASPYFVPDEQIVSALQLAALRGVDVRILIPERPDSKLVYYSAFSYLPEMAEVGVRVYRFKAPAFLHQKVVLCDDDLAAVGTANFDNRSFRLNFEVSLAVRDERFAKEVETMLENDFARSELASATDLTEASFPFRLTVRVCRLLAPIQ